MMVDSGDEVFFPSLDGSKSSYLKGKRAYSEGEGIDSSDMSNELDQFWFKCGWNYKQWEEEYGDLPYM